MHGEAGRLVVDQQVLVFVDQAARQPLGQPLADRGRHRRLGGTNRRNADLIALFQARGLLGALLVHAHLAITDDAIDTGLGYALEVHNQEVIETLTGAVGADADIADAGGGGGLLRHGGDSTRLCRRHKRRRAAPGLAARRPDSSISLNNLAFYCYSRPSGKICPPATRSEHSPGMPHNTAGTRSARH